MPSRYPAAREAESRFHSRYGRGHLYPTEVVADYTVPLDALYESEGVTPGEPTIGVDKPFAGRPSTAPVKEKSSSRWRTGNEAEKAEMRRVYEPVVGGTGDGGPPRARPARPASARAQLSARRLPSCSSAVAVMEASVGTFGSGYSASSVPGSSIGVVKGVAAPAWSHRARFEPTLGGTVSGKTTKRQSYKEQRLAHAGYFSATVAGASLVVKSQGAAPLSEREAKAEARPGSAKARVGAGAAGKKRRNTVANRPEWQRPTSGIAVTRASLARPDLEQLRSGPGGEWKWDMRGGRGHPSIVQPVWNSRMK